MSVLGFCGNPVAAADALLNDSGFSGKWHITVVRRECYEDFQSRYLSDPEAGPCMCFANGDSFDVNRSNYASLSSGGFVCRQAWNAIVESVRLRVADGASDNCAELLNESEFLVSCGDGTRPVIFEVRVEQ